MCLFACPEAFETAVCDTGAVVAFGAIAARAGIEVVVVIGFDVTAAIGTRATGEVVVVTLVAFLDALDTGADVVAKGMAVVLEVLILALVVVELEVTALALEVVVGCAAERGVRAAGTTLVVVVLDETRFFGVPAAAPAETVWVADVGTADTAFLVDVVETVDMGTLESARPIACGTPKADVVE